jgi:hypothetical protein
MSQHDQEDVSDESCDVEAAVLAILKHIVDPADRIPANALLLADLSLDDWQLFELMALLHARLGFLLPEQFDVADVRVQDLVHYARLSAID